MRVLVLIAALLLNLSPVQSQVHQPNASEIRLKLKKLNFLGSVLYVAAHPDDENTRAIAYLANERLAATAYLSMTRGDGGQNLIGPEIRDLLGLIRTQELLAARRIDGGEQFFTRANDFGFSKNANETFAIWNKEEILSDVVRVIRQYQPDVILTRFPPDERAGHGHHTASAILAQEAFDRAAQRTSFAEQLKSLEPWQTKRLFTNTGRWWNTSINENTPGVVTLNVGTYNALLGKSYSELAAESRSQHKSQGFGSTGRRGDAPEYFEFVKGEPAQSDIFDGVNTSWTRVKGGEKVAALVNAALKEFDADQPHTIIPRLLEIRRAIGQLEAGVWRDRKVKEVNRLIQDCAGLYVEVTAPVPSLAPGEQTTFSVELVNRSAAAIELKSMSSKTIGMDSSASLKLGNNQLVTFPARKTIMADAGYSAPYWLQEDHSQGLFVVKDDNLIGKPENSPAVTVNFAFLVAGELLIVQTPVVNKWTDPVKGELWQPFEITPPVSLTLDEKVFLFPDTQSRPVRVKAKSYSNASLNGTLQLQLPSGWRCEPANHALALGKRGEEATYEFTVFPSTAIFSGKISASVAIGGKTYGQSIQTITYDHIPTQTIMPPAASNVIRMDIRKAGDRIGYIKGAGDDVPAALRNLGYEVWEMKNEEIVPANLQTLDAVVLGVRALNTNERIRYFMPTLLDYVKAGGTLVVQYNTQFGLEIDANAFTPYPLKLSRERVTEEDSPVTILNPEHPLLRSPNVITSDDFKGWVQERGLYFPGEWAPEFEPLLSMNDQGEPARKGSLLVAKYGKGTYIYTGLSFFRELPEGVPGALKLFANLVSAGKVAEANNGKTKASRK